MTDPTANDHPLPEPASPSAPDHGLNPTEPVPVGGPAPTPAMPPSPSPTRRGWNIGDAILVVAVVAAIAAIGFAAGRLTGPATTGAQTIAVIPNGGFGNGGPFQGGSGNGGQGGLRGGIVGRGLGAGVGIQGTVTEVAADHLTLTLASGQTVRIPIDPSTTQYHRQTAASASDVTTGSQVLVQLGQGRAANTAPNGGGRTLPAASSITIVGQ